MTKRILFWFRNDLRLIDNEGLSKAIQEADEVIPVFVFDPRQYAVTPLGFPKTGTFRTKFQLESVQNLRDNLKKIGANLVVKIGKPENVIDQLAHDWQVDAVYCSKEVTYEETEIEAALSKRLKVHNTDFELFWGATLYHPRDLPFWVSRLPAVFTDYRKTIEKEAKIRPTFSSPTQIVTPKGLDFGSLPEIYELILFSALPTIDDRTVVNFKGGETEAQKRLNDYCWTNDCPKTYKETRNGLLGANYSSKLSLWLANGCLSPRTIYEELKRYENDRVANESTYWLIFELIWRDYFRFVALKHGTRIFKVSGIKHDLIKKWQHDKALFQQWINGQTTESFVNANMKELQLTGFMSNRGRQNVASFLVNDLNINWTWGAAYFESQLIDYDVCSNWGNWNYMAGVGNDPRENRYFDIQKQASIYDPEGDYIKNWL